MSTSSISNVLSGLPAPANGGKQDAGAAQDAGVFNQMLSQATDRGNANEAAQGTKKDSAGNGDKSKSDAAKNDTASQAEGSKAADGTKPVEGDKATPIAKDKDDDTETDPVATASAEIIAFVAALTQAGSGTATPVAAAGADIKARIAGIDNASDPKLDPSALTAGTASEKEAAGKKSDFVSALDKATAGTADNGGKTPAPAATVKTDAELAIAAQVLKTLEPAAASTPQNIAATTTAALQHASNIMHDPQSNKLMPQVGGPDWDQALGQKIVWMAQGAHQTATLTLNPPDLGPMQVTVNVSNNQATANFTAHQPEVRHALEAAMPRLREMLNDAGIQLGQSSVSAGSPNQQGNAFSDQRQGGRQSGHAGNAMEPAVNVSHIPTPSGGKGMVDTFA